MPTILEKSQYSGKISSLYSRLAWMYDLFTDHELAYHRAAIEIAQIQPQETILEVACGRQVEPPLRLLDGLRQGISYLLLISQKQ